MSSYRFTGLFRNIQQRGLVSKCNTGLKTFDPSETSGPHTPSRLRQEPVPRREMRLYAWRGPEQTPQRDAGRPLDAATYCPDATAEPRTHTERSAAPGSSQTAPRANQQADRVGPDGL